MSSFWFMKSCECEGLKHDLLCMNSSLRSKYDLLKLLGIPCVTLFFVNNLLVVLIVTNDAHVINYLLVVSTKRSLLALKGYFVAKMLKNDHLSWYFMMDISMLSLESNIIKLASCFIFFPLTIAKISTSSQFGRWRFLNLISTQSKFFLQKLSTSLCSFKMDGPDVVVFSLVRFMISTKFEETIPSPNS